MLLRLSEFCFQSLCTKCLIANGDARPILLRSRQPCPLLVRGLGIQACAPFLEERRQSNGPEVWLVASLAHGTLSPPTAAETPLSLWPQLQTQPHPRLGHQDCLPLGIPGGPFFQCSRDPIGIQPFSGQMLSSMTESLPCSCNEFASLNPMTSVDSSAGIPASHFPEPSSSGTRARPPFCFHPTPGSESRPDSSH